MFESSNRFHCKHSPKLKIPKNAQVMQKYNPKFRFRFLLYFVLRGTHSSTQNTRKKTAINLLRLGFQVHNLHDMSAGVSLRLLWLPLYFSHTHTGRILYIFGGKFEPASPQMNHSNALCLHEHTTTRTKKKSTEEGKTIKKRRGR